MPTPFALPQKQSSNQDDWLTAWAEIRRSPDLQRVDRLVDTAAARLRRFVAGSRAAYGWSGGKDSLALEVVADAAGLERSVLVISGLEYPAFLAWVTSNMPWGLTIECQEHLNLGWLTQHPEMLFPTGKWSSAWFAKVQHAGQRRYATRTGLQVLVLGRRRADGNHLGSPVGADGQAHAYTDRGGFARYSPISLWTHEDVLHVLAAYQVTLPPCYAWPRGFRVGTGPWPARQWTESRLHGWSEIAQIDPSILALAAEADLPDARRALALLPTTQTQTEETSCAD